MKKFIYLSVLLVLVLGSFSAAMAQAPEKPAQIKPSDMLGTAVRAGIGNVTGSTVNYVTPDFLPAGSAFDLCFNVYNTSNDAEYMDGFDVDLPDNWAVNYLIDVPGDGCGNGHTYGVNAGNVIYWYTNGMPTGCGDWFYGTRDFCANVTIPDCGGSPWDLAWNIWGDTWGSPPHSVSGIASKICQQAGVYLTPASQDGSACEGDDVTYTVDLFNYTGVDSFFDITFDSIFPIVGPGQVYALNGETVPFDVTVTVPCGGQEDYATVFATGGGFQGSAAVHTVVSAGGWINIPPSPVTTMDHAAIEYMDKLYVMMGYGSNGAVQILDSNLTWSLGASNPNAYNDYSNDGCLGLDAAGNPVIDILGDASTFFNIQRYDINTNTWATLPYPAGYSGLWAPDIVSMYQHTGENVCYISGGATAPGGGNTNALYAYNPADQTIANLGNFSYMPTGIAFHFSWYVPWIGTAGAICAGGGVDANSVVSGDTQCYWIAEQQFGGVSADLGPLPQPWWGGADAWKEHDNYRLFGVNGVDAGFALLQKSFFWDGTGFVYGPDPIHAVYRMEGDNYLGSVFAANGSTGGFSPSTLEEWLQQCEPCEPPDDPDIEVNPTSLSAEQCPDEVTIQTLQICNVGGGELTWSLAEQPVLLGGAARPAAPKITLPAGAPASLAAWLAAGKPAPAARPAAPSAPAAAPEALSFYSSRAVFDGDFPGLPVEGFENGSMGYGTVDVVPHPLDQYSSNLYFDPGDILPGIQFWAQNTYSGDEIAVVGEQFMGNPTKTAVANYFTDAYRIVFDPPVQAAGMDLQEFMGAYSCQLDIYTTAGWAGATTSACNEAGTFWGLASDAEPITEVMITSLGGGAEGADNVAFGGGAPPDVPWLSENPTSGTVAPGTCQDVTVAFDSTGLALGDYFANLVVDSNDPDEPTVTVPVHLAVVECAENTMHINRMRMNWRLAGQPGFVKVIALVRIYDQNGAAVVGAEVFGDWTYPDGGVWPGQYVLLTDDLGRTKFRVKEPWFGEYEFCVTGMTLAGYVYDPDANEDGPCVSATTVP